MDEMTQQNAALVEEAAAAAESLQDQAATLADLMSYFTLEGAENASVRPANLTLLKADSRAEGSVGTAMRARQVVNG